MSNAQFDWHLMVEASEVMSTWGTRSEAATQRTSDVTTNYVRYVQTFLPFDEAGFLEGSEQQLNYMLLGSMVYCAPRLRLGESLSHDLDVDQNRFSNHLANLSEFTPLTFLCATHSPIS